MRFIFKYNVIKLYRQYMSLSLFIFAYNLIRRESLMSNSFLASFSARNRDVDNFSTLSFQHSQNQLNYRLNLFYEGRHRKQYRKYHP